MQDGHLDFHTAPEFVHSMLLYVHRDHRDRGECRTATLTFTQLLSLFIQCCFMSTETIGTEESADGHLDFHTAPEFVHSMLLYIHRDHRDRGESMTATLTFTQLLSLFIQCCFMSTETIGTEESP